MPYSGIFGRGITDQYETVNFDRLRRERVEKARAQMTKDGLGAVLCLENENVRYLSSYYLGTWTDPGMGMYWVLLPRTGKPILGISIVDHLGVLKEVMPWLEGRIYLFPGWGMGGEKQIADLLDEAGVKNEPLGIDGPAYRGLDLFFMMQDNFKKLGINLVPGQQTMLMARRVKTKDEIELMRMACGFADAGFEAARANIRPGITERQLAGIIMKAEYEAGADYLRPPLVCSGYKTSPNWMVHSDKPIMAGDMVFIDNYQVACCGYLTCYYRTFTCGRASQQQKEAYQGAYEMEMAALGKVKAGNTTWDVASQWPDPEHWGYTQPEARDLITANAVGHCLGLSIHEPPLFWKAQAKRDPVVLEEGMVIATEPYEDTADGKEGCRIEENTAVTKDGYDLLTKWPIKEITEAWI